eukprot:75474_1
MTSISLSRFNGIKDENKHLVEGYIRNIAETNIKFNSCPEIIVQICTIFHFEHFGWSTNSENNNIFQLKASDKDKLCLTQSRSDDGGVILFGDYFNLKQQKSNSFTVVMELGKNNSDGIGFGFVTPQFTQWKGSTIWNCIDITHCFIACVGGANVDWYGSNEFILKQSPKTDMSAWNRVWTDNEGQIYAINI